MKRLASEGDIQSLSTDALAYFFGLGALIVGASCAFGRPNSGIVLVLATIAAAVAGWLILTRGPVPDWLEQAFVLLATVLVTTVVWVTGTTFSVDALIYIWEAMYVGFFFGLRAMSGQVLWIGICYVTFLTWREPSGGLRADSLIVAFIILACLVPGVSAGLLRRYIDFLIRRLRAAAPVIR